MATLHEKRQYKNVLVGAGIRGTIDNDKTYRIRRGNGHYGAIDGEIYQDKYDYFVPGSINNVEGAPYRAQWIAAVLHWQQVLTADEKAAYQRRASHGLQMSGYNLFMREAMKGLIEMYVDRGDPAAYDKAKEDLTIDGAWHDWDLSSLVGLGAKAVFIVGHLEGAAVDWAIMFRKKGNTNEINHGGMETIRANIERHRSSIVALSAARVIQYKADNQAWTTLNLGIRGWWI